MCGTNVIISFLRVYQEGVVNMGSCINVHISHEVSEESFRNTNYGYAAVRNLLSKGHPHTCQLLISCYMDFIPDVRQLLRAISCKRPYVLQPLPLTWGQIDGIYFL